MSVYRYPILMSLLATFVLAVPDLGAEVFIAEFLAINETGLQDEDGETSDWIEIHSTGPNIVDLSGYAITDDALNLTKWRFPEGVMLERDDRLVVFASGKDRTVAGAELHANFKLTGGGEFLALAAVDGGTIVSAFDPGYGQQFADVSYGLESDNKTLAYFNEPTPGVANSAAAEPPIAPVTFSLSSQVFSESVMLEMESSTPDTHIVYTIDGKEPTIFNSKRYTVPVEITKSTQIRARAQRSSSDAGPLVGRQFTKVSPELATFSSPLPIIVLDNFGSGKVPQRSSSTGPNGNDGSGVNQVARQPALMTIYERAESGESSPADAKATVSSAGIRVRGSSSGSLAKKAFSVETWNDGVIEDAKDIEPFGMPAESDWVLYAPTETFGGNRYDQPLLHNSFIYRLSNEIGQYAARTQFVEVFLNTNDEEVTMSDHAGLYIFMEKIKPGRDRIDIEKLSQDGTEGGWIVGVDRMDPVPLGSEETPRHFHTPGPNQILETDNDSKFGVRNRDDLPSFYHSFFKFNSPDGYAINSAQRQTIESVMNAFEDALYGPDWTDPEIGYAASIDVDNFIDHFILHNLTKNQDAFVLSTWLYRDGPSDKLKFGPIWDFDRGYTTSPTDPNPGSNLLWAADRMWFPRLFDDINFEQKYIDRWQELREGAFATAHLHAIIAAQMAEITEPVAERNGTTGWPGKVAAMKTWLDDRTKAIDKQFPAKPKMSRAGGAVPENFELAFPGSIFTSVYFTMDGTDPRLPGGEISPTATKFQTGQPLVLTESRTVIARTFSRDEWSGPTMATFVVGAAAADANNLAISEIMYNPVGPDDQELAAGFRDGDQFEYLEVTNISSNDVDVSGVSFTDGIAFTFPAGQSSLLAPGERALVVKNRNAFEQRYGGDSSRRIAGEFDNDSNLRNSGERLELTGIDSNLIRGLTYNDRNPWPTGADGAGFSLVLDSPRGNPEHDLSTSWRQSTVAGGSPGTGESVATTFTGDPNADNDGDGLNRLIEFALGSSDDDPADGVDVLSSTIETIAGPAGERGDYIILSFHRNLAAGIRLTVESSSDLRTWKDDTVLFDEASVGAGESRVRYRMATPLERGGSTYLRLRIDLE
jgi:hypothetical protein